jgi:hypothetical protein
VRLGRTVVVLMMVLTRPLSADSPVTLTIYPRFSQAPATVRVSILIPRDPRNRQACVTLEGENYYRSSCWEHIGEGARYQTVIYYPDLPAGHYSAVGELAREMVKEGRTTVRTPVVEFMVLGVGESPDPEP